jgi:hypothetical protein
VPDPDSAIRRLDPLVGEWRMEASIDGQPTGRAKTVFEWIEGTAFLVQHTDVVPSDIEVPAEWAANSPFPIVTVFGLDDFSDRFSMLYADGRGVRRVYEMTFAEGEWNVWGGPGPEFFQRFTATLSDAGDVIAGRWEG